MTTKSKALQSTLEPTGAAFVADKVDTMGARCVKLETDHFRPLIPVGEFMYLYMYTHLSIPAKLFSTDNSMIGQRISRNYTRRKRLILALI